MSSFETWNLMIWASANRQFQIWTIITLHHHGVTFVVAHKLKPISLLSPHSLITSSLYKVFNPQAHLNSPLKAMPSGLTGTRLPSSATISYQQNFYPRIELSYHLSYLIKCDNFDSFSVGLHALYII